MKSCHSATILKVFYLFYQKLFAYHCFLLRTCRQRSEFFISYRVKNRAYICSMHLYLFCYNINLCCLLNAYMYVKLVCNSKFSYNNAHDLIFLFINHYLFFISEC